MLHGVDVSGHQPNWVPAPDDSFVFVKSTEGSTYVSDDAPNQLAVARRQGLQVGHYHFLWPGKAVQQAAWFVERSDIQAGDLLVCDWENTAGGHPTVADAANFIAEVKRLRPKNRVGLYCNRSAWTQTTVKAGDFLWIADWTTASLPRITAQWAFWQYTDRPIDQNHANSRWKTLDELKAWASSTEPLPLYSEKWGAEYIPFNSGSNKWITPLDRTIVIACARAAGWGTVRLTQGGLSTSVTDSAMTHAGLGVGDISVDERPKSKVWEMAAAMNRSGLRAFPRGFGGDPWEDEQHIHWGSREHYANAHDQLQTQIREMEAGGDGLRGDGAYNGPDVPLGRWKDSPYNPVNIKADTGVYYVNTSVLNGRNVDNVIKYKRIRGYPVQAAQQVFRWGRWNVVTATPTYYSLAYLSTSKPA